MKGQAMVVVREVLEGMLAPNVAQAVLFDSLDTLPTPPQTTAQWLEFAQGPLHQVVTHRVGAVEATEVSARLRTILGALAHMPRPGRRSREKTGRIDRRAGPTRVLVMAASSRLARMLKAALGPTVITVSCTDLKTYIDVVTDLSPSIFLVDLTNAASVPHEVIKSALSKLPKRTIVLIWDQGTPQGEALANTLTGAGHPVAWVDRREGVEPLLDHIRAAHA